MESPIWTHEIGHRGPGSLLRTAQGHGAVRRFSVDIRGGKSLTRGLEMMDLCPFSRKP